MLIIGNGVSTGFNDFYPSFSVIFVRENQMKVCDWDRYNKWLPILLVGNVVFVILLLAIFFVNSAFQQSLVYGSLVVYLSYVAFRQYVFRKKDFIITSKCTVAIAPFKAWLEQFLYDGANIIICISTYSLMDGRIRILLMLMLGLCVLFLILPVLNLIHYRFSFSN